MGDAAGATGGTFFSPRPVLPPFDSIEYDPERGFVPAGSFHETLAETHRPRARRFPSPYHDRNHLGLVCHPPGGPEEARCRDREAGRRGPGLAAPRPERRPEREAAAGRAERGGGGAAGGGINTESV